MPKNTKSNNTAHVVIDTLNTMSDTPDYVCSKCILSAINKSEKPIITFVNITESGQRGGAPPAMLSPMGKLNWFSNRKILY